MVRKSACSASMRCASSSRLWLVNTRSMRCTRASRSFMRMYTGSSSGAVAHPTIAKEARATANQRCVFTQNLDTELLQVHDLDAAVEPISLLVAARGRGTFFAITHGRQLRLGNTLQCERAAHRLAAAFAETDVVLTRTTLVGMSFEAHFLRGVLREIRGVRGHDALRICADVGAIEIEIDDALRKQLARRPRRCVGITYRGIRVVDTGGGVGGGCRRRRGHVGLLRGTAREQRQGGEQSRNRNEFFHCHTCRPCGNVHGWMVDGRNGPHTGSRTSPASASRRAETWPSTETVCSTPCPRSRPAKISIAPFGAKLGDSSWRPLDNTCTVPLDRSWMPMRYAP